MHRVENAVREQAVRGLQLRALELETPRFERRVAPVGKPQTALGPGWASRATESSNRR